MKNTIDLQLALENDLPVSKKLITQWAKAALGKAYRTYELTIRCVEKEEIRALNHTYRQQDKPTNVLAFPSSLPPEIQNIHPFLGDVIICPKILEEESHHEHIPLIAHWAHIVIHGVLHLQGYDHIETQDAKTMQALEIKLLSELGFSNPYASEDHHVE